VAEAFEYRRYQSGANPFFTPLRFPGQYHDDETDYFENWNRMYEPQTGRYLASEPMLQRPGLTRWMARRGLPTPAYAYGLNNSNAFYDPNGLGVINWSSKTWYYKDEDTPFTDPVEPGGIYWGYQDGVAPEHCGGTVYKTTNFQDVIITDRFGPIPLPTPWTIIHLILGGWKDPNWVADHPNWVPLGAR